MTIPEFLSVLAEQRSVLWWSIWPRYIFGYPYIAGIKRADHTLPGFSPLTAVLYFTTGEILDELYWAEAGKRLGLSEEETNAIAAATAIDPVIGTYDPDLRAQLIRATGAF